HGRERDTTTSNRHREPITPERTGAKPELRTTTFPRSGRGTQPYTFGHDAVARETPERDQQLARQRHDQRLAHRRGIRRSLPIPLGERTVLLEQEKPPGEL